MSTPVFEDVEPLPACGCEECARRRLADSVARDGGGPATGATARAMLVVAAAGTALGGAATAAVAAPVPGAVTGPAAGRDALSAPSAVARAAAAPLRLTRAQILDRAESWMSARVPYSMTAYWKDGYRQDCSGFVSMAWGLGSSAWTGDLAAYGVRITRDALQPGDILLYHNTADPRHGSHTVVFGGWVDDDHTVYTGYEQTPPGARVRTTPYPYWTHSAKYVPYRYKYLVTGGGSASGAPVAAGLAYPGRGAFGPGHSNSHVTRLGAMLIGRGGGGYYEVGPGPRWGTADRDATRAFQRAQGWTGPDADGIPGPTTWSYLIHHHGHDIPPPHASAVTAAKVPAGAGGTTAVPSAKPPAKPPANAPAGGTGMASKPPAKAPAAETAAPPPAKAPAAPLDAHPPVVDRVLGGGVPPYPGGGVFRPGRGGDAVLALGRRLVVKGFGKHYRTGPSGVWGEADRRNVEAFQRAQGWSGRQADGYPGPETWRRLFT
ncbi:peptidoglycan-binding protein [Streptomyces sp. NPDC051976]|uniref:peptidoglycan-binding protein n=1 Tax=Streptomyces sp. NPDC051976 TaxID=3154947 RepID=UPI00343BB120